MPLKVKKGNRKPSRQARVFKNDRKRLWQADFLFYFYLTI